MSTVARTLREESRARLLRMTPAERLAEALRLGQRAIASYAAAHGLDHEEARRALERAAQAGRRYSRVMRDLAG
jgi:cell division inhibitor SulA